ncbi:hypothetical protein [Candidatus Mycobacterium methanotrophicum]|uniref:hypothetical protein n=1 Tax=Candidatus Mycobacterium methanotrophicum TaxID=2943498 RepID=UPI001C57281F|nr:hypothetical protein [Candidatus Mycobacterium methanotrophicum]
MENTVQVLQISFATAGQSAAQASLHAAQIAFVGPLLGWVARLYGGRFADRLGRGKVALGSFVGMIGGVGIFTSRRDAAAGTVRG